jgi:hypothetical protein
LSKKIISTDYSNGKKHDFKLFSESETHALPSIAFIGDMGYIGLQEIHKNSIIPHKATKNNKLTKQQKKENRLIAQKRVSNEHVIRSVKIFRIISDRYRNRRKRFGLRFNLISAIYNHDLI